MNYFFVFPIIAILGACSGHGTETYLPPHIETEHFSFSIDTLATGLENPWGMAFLPDGRILIAERPGRLRIWEDGKLLDEGVTGLPDIWAHGQGGLLEVTLHPDYGNNGLIYLAHAALGNGGGSTAITRGRLEGSTLKEVETIFHGRPHTTARHHFGSRIVFDDEATSLPPLATGARWARPRTCQAITAP